MIIKETTYNEQLKKNINDLQEQINDLKLSLTKITNGGMILEKNQLIESIDSILNDVLYIMLNESDLTFLYQYIYLGF